MNKFQKFVHSKAFDNEIPSLFVISSPFQAICSVEAINEFRIKKYSILVIGMTADSRLEQIKSILEYYNLTYKIEKLSNTKLLILISKIIFSKKQYQRAFVGSYLCSDLIYYALSYIYKSSNIVYLDDGNTSIGIFWGYTRKEKIIYNIKRNLILKLASLKKVSADIFFYSIYSDIENNKYFIKENPLISLNPKNNNSILTEYVVFVGTNSTAFCVESGLSRNEYISILFNYLELLKSCYEGKNIVYIPHGRDSYEEISKFCDKIKINFTKIDTCIEFYLIQQRYNPIYITGFSSSALLNLKKIFPNCIVENLLIKNHTSDEYKIIANYYQKHTIVKKWLSKK